MTELHTNRVKPTNIAGDALYPHCCPSRKCLRSATCSVWGKLLSDVAKSVRESKSLIKKPSFLIGHVPCPCDHCVRVSIYPLPLPLWERNGARGDGEGGQLRFGLGWFQLTTYKGQAGHQLTQRLFNDRQIVVR